MEPQVPFNSALVPVLAILLFAPLSSSQQECTSTASGSSAVRAGFWLSNSRHYSPVTSIDTSLYTHLYYYSFPFDFKLAEHSAGDGVDSLTTFSGAVKSRSPSLQTILSVATDEREAGVSNAAFSEMAGDPERRATFIRFAMELARANGFDGIDLAWRFPSTATDMANFGTLLSEWRQQINADVAARSPPAPLLLTATLYFANHLFETAELEVNYPIDAIAYSLDWANVLAFDLHKSSNLTIVDSPLFSKTSHFSASYGIISWIDAGVPACKLVLGIPLFGRSWFLKNKDKNELGAPVVAAGPRQKFSNQTGVMAYSEIKAIMNDSSICNYDNQSVSAYLSSNDLWVSFDSLDVVEEKVKYALHNSLLGYFLWPINFDDANLSVSKQASGSWMRYQDSSDVHNGLPFKQTAMAPVHPPPQDDTSSNSAGSLMATRMSPDKLRYSLHYCALLFISLGYKLLSSS